MNYEKIVYVGQRASLEKSFQGQRYTFIYGKPVSVPDGMAAGLLATTNFVRSASFGRSVEALYPGGGTLIMRRWGALGDLIMLRAAVSAFSRTGGRHRFILRAQDRFVDILCHDTTWEAAVGLSKPLGVMKYDGVITMDQVAEQDHRGVEKHRTTLFLEAMTNREITIQPEDWRIPLPEHVVRWVDRHLADALIHPDQRERPLVALQVRGSGPMKTLPAKVVSMIIGRCIESGWDVVLIENEDRVARPFEREHVYTMTGRDPLHGMAMLARADLAITMDSGALWMAHVAACPTLAILGPTRADQRISFHPKYPHGARAVALNEMINCPACFEAAERCRGTYACMRDQPDWGRVVDAVAREAASIIAGESANIPLPIASNHV